MYKFKVYDKTTDGVIEREFRNAFPLEGNRNTSPRASFLRYTPESLETPSRLKGIETRSTPGTCRGGCRLETPSRWKGIETLQICRCCHFQQEPCLETPSRLKGIETQSRYRTDGVA